MSKTQIQIAIGLLLIVNLSLPVLIAPFGLPVGSDVTALRIGYVTMGAVMAPPALLAVWAGLAPQPLLRRGTQALAMLVCAELALDFAMVYNSGSRSDPAEMLQVSASLVALACSISAGSLVALAICLLPLCLLRARFRWAIAPPAAADMACPREGNQFSMRGMLLGMVFIAALLAASRWLHPGSFITSDLWTHEHNPLKNPS